MTSSWLNCTIEEHEEMVENSRDGVEEEDTTTVTYTSSNCSLTQTMYTIKTKDSRAESKRGVGVMKSELEFLTAVLSDLDIIRAFRVDMDYDLLYLKHNVLDRITEVKDWEVKCRPKGVELTQEEKDSLPNPEED